MQDVEVEPIHSHVLVLTLVKRPRTIPSRVIRSKSLIHKVGKGDAILFCAHLIITLDLVVRAADADEDFDAFLLAVRYILLYCLAVVQEVRRDAVVVAVRCRPAPRAKVGPRIAGLVMFWCPIDPG